MSSSKRLADIASKKPARPAPSVDSDEDLADLLDGAVWDEIPEGKPVPVPVPNVSKNIVKSDPLSFARSSGSGPAGSKAVKKNSIDSAMALLNDDIFSPTVSLSSQSVMIADPAPTTVVQSVKQAAETSSARDKTEALKEDVLAFSGPTAINPGNDDLFALASRRTNSNRYERFLFRFNLNVCI
jgi:hypothetical protein